MIRVTTVGVGRRSSKAATPCSREPAGDGGQGGALDEGEQDHEDEHDVEYVSGAGDSGDDGKVASKMGTAPRRPAQELNACSRHEMPWKGSRQARTETGRVTSSRTRPTTSAGRIRGERAAEAGFGLRNLVRRHLSVARESWPTLSPPNADRVLAVVEQSIDAFAEGHERAQRLAVRQEEGVRREFIDDLLYGRSDLGRLSERAERFGLLLSRAHAVAVAQGGKPVEDMHPITRQVERALIARFGERRSLIRTKDGRLVCIAPGEQEEVLAFFAKQAHAATDGGQIGIGRPHPGAGGVVHSYEEALNALDLADRLDLDEPVLRHAACSSIRS